MLTSETGATTPLVTRRWRRDAAAWGAFLLELGGSGRQSTTLAGAKHDRGGDKMTRNNVHLRHLPPLDGDFSIYP